MLGFAVNFLTDNNQEYTLDMSEELARSDANNCFVCGPKNPVGLKVIFRLEGDVCYGEFTPSQDHGGYEGVTHGGILFSVLDDVMANWLFLKGVRCYTGRCEIRYREPVPPGQLLRLESRLVNKKRAMVVMEGKAIRNETGKVVAEAKARFMVVDWGKNEL